MEENTITTKPVKKPIGFLDTSLLSVSSSSSCCIFSFDIFNHNPNQTAVQGISTSIPTHTPTKPLTPTPTNTPVPTFTPTPTVFIAPTHSTIQSVQPTATQEQGLSNNNYYTNSSGNVVHSPATQQTEAYQQEQRQNVMMEHIALVSTIAAHVQVMAVSRNGSNV